MTVRQVADKLASFVAKNGRQFENITRQRNPGDTPFKYDRATFFFLPTLICFLLWFFSISSILLSISDFKKYWYINLGSFAGFYLTNTVQTTNIMSISLLKRKRLLLSQRRLKHQKVVRGTISL
jgi:hypothetical protein